MFLFQVIWNITSITTIIMIAIFMENQLRNHTIINLPLNLTKLRFTTNTMNPCLQVPHTPSNMTTMRVTMTMNIMIHMNLQPFTLIHPRSNLTNIIQQWLLT